MSEKFVVGQWVTCGSRIARIDYMTDSMADLSDGQGACLVNMRPFVWQVGRTYRTTLDGVTATVEWKTDTSVSGVASDKPGTLCFDAKTGLLIGYKADHKIAPHMLPYLADAPQPVADAATFSEFADGDECDDVNHPAHYTQHPSGVECVDIAEAFNFNIGNAIKYLWRAGLKGDALEDLRKAAWYVQREIERAKR